MVLCVGGTNLDLKARTHGAARPGTSNPGTLLQSPGGVARNVAENLALLGVPTELVSAVGDDPAGTAVLEPTRAAGVGVSRVLRVPGGRTGTYTAVLGSGGELLVAVADMAVMDALGPEHLAPEHLGSEHLGPGPLNGARWVVADGNLRQGTLGALLEMSAAAGVPLAFEPVSEPKAARLRGTLRTYPPHTVTPNRGELGALLGGEVGEGAAELRAAAHELLGWGVRAVWVRLGVRGSVLFTPGGERAHPALPARVRDVSGAGDAGLAAYLAARLRGQGDAGALAWAHAAAALTVESPHTVVPGLSPAAIQSRLKETHD